MMKQTVINKSNDKKKIENDFSILYMQPAAQYSSETCYNPFEI